MTPSRFMFATAVTIVFGFCGSPAFAKKGLDSCRVGQKVVVPGGKTGTVTQVANNTGCTVKQDESGLESVWSAFMLKAAPGSAEPVAQAVAAMPTAGNYQCHGGPAGNLKLSFGPGQRYANEKGTAGEFTIADDGELSFTSGPWAGFFARNLADGKVGLTSRSQSTFYYMTCDRAGGSKPKKK